MTTDREAELFFASRSAEEESDSNADSDDDIEFIGMSEAPGSPQPPRKRRRRRAPAQRGSTPTEFAEPDMERSTSGPALVINGSTEFTISVVRDILKAAERTAPSDVAISWSGKAPPDPDVAHTVMLHRSGPSVNVAVWDHRNRAVNYIYQGGFQVDETVVEDVLDLGRNRKLYNVDDGVSWVAHAAQECPPTVSPAMWACVVMVWLARNHGVQACLELLHQFQIRATHVCGDLNAILRGQHWSGQCYELQGRPRTSRTIADGPHREELAPVTTRPVHIAESALPGSARTAGPAPTPPAGPSHEPHSPPPSPIPNITETTDFTPELVREILASAQKTAPKGFTLAFNDEMMGSDVSHVILVSNVGSS